MLTYGSIADSIDEYIKIWKISALKCLEHFYRSLISCFGKKYSHHANIDDLR
jgi:hypothetical protein